MRRSERERKEEGEVGGGGINGEHEQWADVLSRALVQWHSTENERTDGTTWMNPKHIMLTKRSHSV